MGEAPMSMSYYKSACLCLSFEQAESAADRALSFDPQMIKAHFRRGLARREIGEYVDAILGKASLSKAC